MTLNISLVTPSAIHQSADFRLIDADRWAIVSDSSAKLVHVRYLNWFGTITYCGIGRWRNLDTSQWIARWLSHEFGAQRSMDEVVARIKSQGDKWLAEILSQRSGRPRVHTFVVAAFIGKEAKMSLISNYQRLDAANGTSPESSLRVSTASIRKSRFVITGVPDAVAKFDKTFLKFLSKGFQDPHDIRRLLGLINRRTARGKAAQGTISEACWVNSLMSDGSAEGECYGDVQGELNPIILQDGLDFANILHLNPAPGRKIRTAHISFGSSESQASRTYIKCTPSVVLRELPPQCKRVDLQDLGDLGGSTSRAKASNSLESVIGESYVTPSGPPHGFIWRAGIIIDIGTLGGHSSAAMDINDREMVVGSAVLENSDSHAFLWSEGNGMTDLGTLGGRHSNAQAVSNLGHVVGSSWTVPGQSPTNPVERGFIWTRDKGMREIGSLQGHWSRAAGVNELGQIVGISPVGGFIHTFLYSENGGLLDIGTLGGESTEGLAINNHGQILGMSERPSHELRPFLWSTDTGIIELPIPGRVHVRDINDHGEVIGNVETDLGARSFLWSEELGMIPLPWFDGHRTEASAISNSRTISGQIMGRSNHCHAVIWRVLIT